jgi:hypothetical protein
MPETSLVVFEDIKLFCQVDSNPRFKLAQFYFQEGANRIPVCDLRHPSVAPVTFNLWSTGGQIADLERLQKALTLAARLMEAWNDNADYLVLQIAFEGEQYELSKL